ncbi:hypothetical protein [Pseudomonas oryzihabitans]|uniref:Uncharacterized protein n=1 Tax=Pseudomonas oryzihabitans TaxID=47885 RepID=A0A178LJI2_9PSED|nr:hypothetical protein [Pseudomonas oryzihabitans]OAN31151.1 hypothetical protein A4V15_14180 [Pseudomonas oryzihabitans]
MTERHEIPLDLTTFEALDSALKFHRAAALVSPTAPEPMSAFQDDLMATANQLGFHPTMPGTFRVQVVAGGRNLLVWEQAERQANVREVTHAVA